MEWFTALTELGKGLLGAETARKQGEINALLQLFGIEGEVQRRKMLEREMALREEAHQLQRQQVEAELQMAPLRQRLLAQQVEEAERTAPYREKILGAEAEQKTLQAQRAKFEDLYERGITPDDLLEDEDFTDAFKERYRRYFVVRQFRERLPLITKEEDIADLMKMLPEGLSEQMMAMARFFIRENQIRNYLADLQLDAAELQRYDTARRIAYDTVFNIINRHPNWDKMKTEERVKLLREAIEKANLPPALQNFFTEDALKVFAQMSSETAELVRRAQLIGGIEFGFQRELEKLRRETALASIRAQGEERRRTLEMEANYGLLNQALKQQQGAGAPPAYPLQSYTSFLKRGGLNQYGVVVDKMALDRYMRATADYNNLPINMGNNQTVPFSVIKQEAYNSIVGLSEPTFAVNPNAQRAQKHFSDLIRFRYVELQLAGLDPNSAYSRAIADTEEFINTINSPQLKALWNQYKGSLR